MGRLSPEHTAPQRPSVSRERGKPAVTGRLYRFPSGDGKLLAGGRLISHRPSHIKINLLSGTPVCSCSSQPQAEKGTFSRLSRRPQGTRVERWWISGHAHVWSTFRVPVLSFLDQNDATAPGGHTEVVSDSTSLCEHQRGTLRTQHKTLTRAEHFRVQSILSLGWYPV